jgi:transposase
MAEEKIVFDKFHIMKHLGEAMDEVRRAEIANCGPRETIALAGRRFYEPKEVGAEAAIKERLRGCGGRGRKPECRMQNAEW